MRLGTDRVAAVRPRCAGGGQCAVRRDFNAPLPALSFVDANTRGARLWVRAYKEIGRTLEFRGKFTGNRGRVRTIRMR